MGKAEGKFKATLERLCRENGWSYGILWRFDPRNSVLLTLEDAVFEDDRVGQVIGKMLRHVQLLGEGAIGQAALTGKHLWMLADAPESQEVDSEVLHQLSAGVQTLVIIPLEHQGVVLFGAMNKIMERAEFVDETKKLFHEMADEDRILQAGNVPSSSNCEANDVNSLFTSFLSQGNSCNGNTKHINVGNGLEELIRSRTCSTAFPIHSTEFVNEAELSDLFENIPAILRQKGSFTEGPCISSWSSDGSVLTSLETPVSSSFFGYLGMDHIQPVGETGNEILKASGLKRPFDEFHTADHSADVSSSCLINDLSQLCDGFPQHGMEGSAIHFDSSIEQFSLGGSGNYLFDSFGMDLSCVLDGNCQDILDNSKEAPSNAMQGFHSSTGQRKGLFSELGIEELLEGMGCSTITTSRGQCLEGSLLNGASNLEHKSQVGLWIDDCYSINAGGASACPPKTSEEQAKPSRKRARPGESTRPRPKDRQQIQDRLKELREIIPNGAKCSIDALLDRTIKHMLFLQNVTKYADKFKQIDEPKLIAREKGSVVKDECRRLGETGTRGGTTWAFEVGGTKPMVCPIIVEDLTPSGHMLIEMVCEEQGLFLEIADIVRGFGLNILKGLMEARDDKIWSHFIVEATRQVTRIDVFWSLAQLLQQSDPKEQDFANPLKNPVVLDNVILPCNNYNQSVLPLPIS